MAFKWSPWIQPPDIWSEWAGAQASGAVTSAGGPFPFNEPAPPGTNFTFQQIVDAPLNGDGDSIFTDTGITFRSGWIICQSAIRFAIERQYYGPFLGVTDEQQDSLGSDWWDIQFENDNQGTPLGPVEVQLTFGGRSFSSSVGQATIYGFEGGPPFFGYPRSSTRARNAGPFEVRVGPNNLLPTNNGPQNGAPGPMQWSTASELAAMPKVTEVNEQFEATVLSVPEGTPGFGDLGNVPLTLTTTADQLPITYVLCHSRNVTGIPPRLGTARDFEIGLNFGGQFRMFYRPPRFRVLINQPGLSAHRHSRSQQFRSYGPVSHA